MKMAERHAELFGIEPQRRVLTTKEREELLLRADPAFAEWLDRLNEETRNQRKETNHGDHRDPLER